MDYLGCNIEQDSHSIYFSQRKYIESLKPAELLLNKDKDRKLSTEEQHNYRAICGQLNWVSSQSRPDIAFEVCQLSTKLNSACVKDILQANKVLKKIQNEVVLKFVKLQYPIHILTYCDASYGNLPDGSSQGGYIIFYKLYCGIFIR